MPEKTDTNILIEDGKIMLPFGGKAVEVRALTIEKSVAWVKEVKNAWFTQAKINADARGIDIKGKKDADLIKEFQGAIEAGAGGDMIMIRDLLVKYGIPAKTVNAGTVDEILSAFDKCYATENPTRRFWQAVMTPPA
ncbi:MAG: hypothetical protein ABIF19_17145 [Planctomycetota bacterium]|uniref:Uncharacterized protein n=1 Tax=viral metagenome TaxID=1070528 RepID=A0A6M3L7E2_9ZZZZ